MDNETATDKKPPIIIHELIQLPKIGVSSENVTWNRVTLTSDRWITIRHSKVNSRPGYYMIKSSPHSGKDREISSECQGFTIYGQALKAVDIEQIRPEDVVTVVDPRDGKTHYSDNTDADSVQMNPTLPKLAFKNGLRFEVFNIETKDTISKSKLHEPVIFWTWVNSDIIAMVTESFVYHWDLCQADCSPEKMFMRHNRLAFSEIISYKADPSLKWLALTGLTPEEDRITGITQLYNVDEGITQCIGAHTVCFSEYHYADNPMSSTVMCAASRDTLDHGKVHVIELGPYKQGNFAPRNNYDVLQYFDDVERFDFPVSLHVSREYGLLFLITKYGFLYLCDMETAACLCCTRISMSIVFATTLNTETQGVLGITRAGQVITCDIKKDGLISYVRDTAKKTNQANRLEKAIAQ